MPTIADICGMHLLLTAATTAEIQPAINFLAKNDPVIPNHPIEILITGVGAVATTYLLTKAINHNKPSAIIQAGIAGSFIPGNTTEVFVVNEDCFGDCGVWENNQFKTFFDLKLADEDKAPYSKRVLKNPYQNLLALPGLKAIRAITVNEISTNPGMIKWYKQNLSPVVESMEGAALHYVCLQENIPFLQMRSVSNEIGERDKTKWNITEAISKLNDKLISLLNNSLLYDETYFRI